MKKNALFLLIIGFSLTSLAQTVKKTGKNIKNGYAKVTKTEPDHTVHHEDARIIFTFVGADGKPAKSHIKVVCNHDSAFPTVNSSGVYIAEVEPGKYKMRFAVPFWHEVTLDSIMCKKKTATHIYVKFEPLDFKAGAVH